MKKKKRLEETSLLFFYLETFMEKMQRRELPHSDPFKIPKAYGGGILLFITRGNRNIRIENSINRTNLKTSIHPPITGE